MNGFDFSLSLQPSQNFMHMNEEVLRRASVDPMWTLSNAFTSAFKELDPIPQFKATAKLSGFLEAVQAL